MCVKCIDYNVDGKCSVVCPLEGLLFYFYFLIINTINDTAFPFYIVLNHRPYTVISYTSSNAVISDTHPQPQIPTRLITQQVEHFPNKHHHRYWSHAAEESNLLGTHHLPKIISCQWLLYKTWPIEKSLTTLWNCSTSGWSSNIQSGNLET